MPPDPSGTVPASQFEAVQRVACAAPRSAAAAPCGLRRVPWQDFFGD